MFRHQASGVKCINGIVYTFIKFRTETSILGKCMLVCHTTYVQIKKPTGEDGRHRVGCGTAVWKERRNHHIMISKQQPKYYDETIWY